MGRASAVMAQYRNKIKATDDETKQKALRVKMNKVAKDVNKFVELNPNRNKTESKYKELARLLKQLKK